MCPEAYQDLKPGDSCGNMCPRMQRFSPEIPWVLVGQYDQHGPLFLAACDVCREQAIVDADQIPEFASLHRVHQAPRGSFRLGDAVAAVAKPIARAFGMDSTCTPCEARRRMLNKLGRSS
jgi:hypothetical protein